MSFLLTLLMVAPAAAQSMPGYTEPEPVAAPIEPTESTPPVDGLPDWVVRDSTGSFSAETKEEPSKEILAETPEEQPKETIKESTLPDWVQQDATGAFAIPVETAKSTADEGANILSVAPIEQGESSPDSSEPDSVVQEAPKRATGHGDQRLPITPKEARAQTQWPPQTAPSGVVHHDLSEAFLSAMANARPLAKRLLTLPQGDDSDLGDRAAFERTLEKRIDELLDAMLGPGLARTFIRAAVETVPGSGLIEMTDEREKTAALWDEIQGRLESTPPVLPGYPLPHALKAEVLSRVAAAAAPVRKPDRSRAILTVSLLVDHSVEERDLTPVTAAVADAVGLDPDRGDILQITRASIRPTWASLLKTNKVRGAMLIAACIALGLGIPICIAIFMGGKTRELFSARTHISEQKPSTDFASHSETDFDPTPFWNDSRYAQAVADFLAKQPAQSAAALLGLLSHEAAGTVFRNLPEKQRRRIAALLASGTPIGAKELFTIGQLRRQLREHLTAHATGPGLLEELLLRAPERVRDGLIGDLRRSDPERAARLARSVPSLRDIARANEPALRLCMSPFSTPDLVCAFYEFDEAAREKILEALPLLVREDIREELKTFVPESMETVESARARITARWRQLELDGRVTPYLSASANSV